MVYGSLENVKVICSICAEVDSFDDELDLLLVKASDFINDALRPYVASLPLGSPAGVIEDVAEFYAAGLYLQKNALDEKPHSYLVFAERKLADYVRNNFGLAGVRGKVKVSSYSEIDETQ